MPSLFLEKSALIWRHFIIKNGPENQNLIIKSIQPIVKIRVLLLHLGHINCIPNIFRETPVCSSLVRFIWLHMHLRLLLATPGCHICIELSKKVLWVFLQDIVTRFSIWFVYDFNALLLLISQFIFPWFRLGAAELHVHWHLVGHSLFFLFLHQFILHLCQFLLHFLNTFRSDLGWSTLFIVGFEWLLHLAEEDMSKGIIIRNGELLAHHLPSSVLQWWVFNVVIHILFYINNANF